MILSYDLIKAIGKGHSTTMVEAFKSNGTPLKNKHLQFKDRFISEIF